MPCGLCSRNWPEKVYICLRAYWEHFEMSHGVVLYESNREVSSTSFKWSIPNVFLLDSSHDTTYSSPPIDIFEGRLVLEIFTFRHYGCADEEYRELLLSGSSRFRNPPTGLRFTVAVKKTDGTEEILMRDQTISAESDQFASLSLLGWPQLRDRKSELAPSGVLTLSFRFAKKPQPIQTGDPTLHTHMKDLLHSGDDHDVTIRVKHKEFRAHKCILRARSPVFAAMFRHDMKENTGGPVSIEDCDPEAFGEFLNYVYTGKVDDPSPSKALGLYYLGDKYDFLRLKEVCVDYLKDSLSISAICDVVDLARRHGEYELLQCAIDFFSRNTKEILCSKEWCEFAKKNFDVANELYIKAYEAK